MNLFFVLSLIAFAANEDAPLHKLRSSIDKANVSGGNPSEILAKYIRTAEDQNSFAMLLGDKSLSNQERYVTIEALGRYSGSNPVVRRALVALWPKGQTTPQAGSLLVRALEGAAHHEDVTQRLIGAIESSDIWLRRSALLALGDSVTPRTEGSIVEALLRSRSLDTDPHFSGLDTLARYVIPSHKKLQRLFMSLLAHEHWYVRATAAEALHVVSADEKVRKALLESARRSAAKSDFVTAQLSLYSLRGHALDPEVNHLLVQSLTSPSHEVRVLAITELTEIAKIRPTIREILFQELLKPRFDADSLDSYHRGHFEENVFRMRGLYMEPFRSNESVEECELLAHAGGWGLYDHHDFRIRLMNVLAENSPRTCGGVLAVLDEIVESRAKDQILLQNLSHASPDVRRIAIKAVTTEAQLEDLLKKEPVEQNRQLILAALKDLRKPPPCGWIGKTTALAPSSSLPKP